jgi:hypothetical protein
MKDTFYVFELVNSVDKKRRASNTIRLLLQRIGRHEESNPLLSDTVETLKSVESKLDSQLLMLMNSTIELK